MSKGLQLSGKKLLYRLLKGNYLKCKSLSELASDANYPSSRKNGRFNDLTTLRRLIKKGLVFRNKFEDGYHLTTEGRKVAEEIALEVDEYKRW